MDVQYVKGEIIPSEVMGIMTVDKLSQIDFNKKYRIVKAYADNQFNNLGYVRLDYVMDITGIALLDIITILYEEDYYPIPFDSHLWVKEETT